ncbi:hypothetical protein BDV36DRAFT_24846 [Aspergillus pseudocaelatus]|uniref:Uncharacterized protein n=1 Tax=Aspergillus pseudocaelatus TaxID=1825620 RepID=A0ABQ6W9B6_9EURO|nr:hypothetical protein BDV36DRAFT_24846 [Aspergillus pseudocaelatus]
MANGWNWKLFLKVYIRLTLLSELPVLICWHCFPILIWKSTHQLLCFKKWGDTWMIW